jgi:NiFe hydrogenase small subunit HydA
MFYGQRLHDKCYRRPHFDAGQFVEKFDDEGARKGYCLYKVGCKGPTTYNACSTVEWNGGLSWPVKSGHGCLGCAEDNFWDKGSFPGCHGQRRVDGGLDRWRDRRRSSHWCCGTRGHFGYREGKRQEGKGGRGGEQWLA